MLRLSSLIPRAVLALLLTYMLVIGATFNGILTAPTRVQTVVVLGISVIVWLAARWRKPGTRWHRTALDAAILLWVAAFAVSLLANLESWRRIAIGLWYMGAYITLWYALHDALANRLIGRTMLVDALLFAGLMIVVMGYMQVQTWARDTLPLMMAGDEPLILPRPVSTLGNPNTLASALVMLLPLAVGRALTGTLRLQRLLMWLYALAGLILLLLTYSRGGWLAAIVGLVVLVLWLLAEQNRLTPAYWRAWWHKQRRRVRFSLIAAAGIALAALAIAAVLFLRTFTIGGRTLDLRTFLYDTALAMFAEKPITGYGLFTYGAGLARLNSVPPTQPHSHAHNLPMQVAAELGLVGLAALLLSLWQIYRAVRANLRALPREHQRTPEAKQAFSLRHMQADRITIILAMLAFVGFSAHHIPDLAAMNPAIMVMALVSLSAGVAPVKPQPVSAPVGRVLSGVAVAGCALLLLSGLWSSLIYQQYTDAVRYGINTRDYVGAAERLRPVTAADPEMAVYHQQRGFLLGLAVAEGNTSLLPEAIAEFERYTSLAPTYSLGWANLGALYAQAGEYAQAVAAMGRAVELAPEAAPYADRLREYREAAASGRFDTPTIPRPISLQRDDLYLPDINFIQWLRLSIERQFLPQVRFGE